MSDLEARVVRLEQIVQQLLRDLTKAQNDSGTAQQLVAAIRNAPSS